MEMGISRWRRVFLYELKLFAEYIDDYIEKCAFSACKRQL